MKTTKKILYIDGMHCSSCAMNIDFDLEDLVGVISSKTNYAKQVCEVEYDPQKISEKQIIDQIQKTGYSIRLN